MATRSRSISSIQRSTQEMSPSRSKISEDMASKMGWRLLPRLQKGGGGLVDVDLPRPSTYFSVSGSWINQENLEDGGLTSRTGEAAVDVKGEVMGRKRSIRGFRILYRAPSQSIASEGVQWRLSKKNGLETLPSSW